MEQIACHRKAKLSRGKEGLMEPVHPIIHDSLVRLRSIVKTQPELNLSARNDTSSGIGIDGQASFGLSERVAGEVARTETGIGSERTQLLKPEPMR